MTSAERDFPVATQFLRSKLQAAKVQHYSWDGPRTVDTAPRKGDSL